MWSMWSTAGASSQPTGVLHPLSPVLEAIMTRDDRYNPSEIERKWRRRWEESGLYHTDLALSGEHAPDEAGKGAAPLKFYNLMEFPYPSAEGLHIGHVYTYGGADTNGRFQRMRGHTVFE